MINKSSLLAALVLGSVLWSHSLLAKERMISGYRCADANGSQTFGGDFSTGGLVHLNPYNDPLICPIPSDSYMGLAGISGINVHGVDEGSIVSTAASAQACVDYSLSAGGSCSGVQYATNTGIFTISLTGSSLTTLHTYWGELGYLYISVPGNPGGGPPYSTIKGYYIWGT